MKVAVLGLGAMGSRMAMNIIKAGYQVTVWNWSAKAAEPLVGASATHAATPKEAAAGRDFFIAMLRDRLTVTELESPNDYRQHRLAGAQVYFHPAGKARPQIDAIWTDLTGGTAGVPLTLPVNGREVEIPRFANGIGRATFWEFCARPLGAADFLAIAAAVRVLILEDIPQLSASNYNEAKRFVMLIDALYEAKVRLICSAADEPEQLYTEGTGSFEFERTASRLREMQSAGWGQ